MSNDLIPIGPPTHTCKECHTQFPCTGSKSYPRFCQFCACPNCGRSVDQIVPEPIWNWGPSPTIEQIKELCNQLEEWERTSSERRDPKLRDSLAVYQFHPHLVELRDLARSLWPGPFNRDALEAVVDRLRVLTGKNPIQVNQMIADEAVTILKKPAELAPDTRQAGPQMEKEELIKAWQLTGTQPKHSFPLIFTIDPRFAFDPEAPEVKVWEAPSHFLSPGSFDRMYFVDGKWFRHLGTEEGPPNFASHHSQSHALDWFIQWGIDVPQELEKLAYSVSKGPGAAKIAMAVLEGKKTGPTSPDQPLGEIKPKWNPERRELIYGSSICKTFRQPAKNQQTILAAFQDDNWPSRIDDPLPGDPNIDTRQRLADAVRGLNKNDHIFFELDGTGEGILWKPREEAP